jgi:hypothetical protein
VKRRIGAAQVILDQLVDVAVIELIGEPLPRLKIEPRLIEMTAEALSVLRDEARDETTGHHRGDQQQSVEQTAQNRR